MALRRVSSSSTARHPSTDLRRRPTAHPCHPLAEEAATSSKAAQAAARRALLREAVVAQLSDLKLPLPGM